MASRWYGYHDTHLAGAEVAATVHAAIECMQFVASSKPADTTVNYQQTSKQPQETFKHHQEFLAKMRTPPGVTVVSMQKEDQGTLGTLVDGPQKSNKSGTKPKQIGEIGPNKGLGL